jgi:hypothetical protein
VFELAFTLGDRLLLNVVAKNYQRRDPLCHDSLTYYGFASFQGYRMSGFLDICVCGKCLCSKKIGGFLGLIIAMIGKIKGNPVR